MHTRMFPLYFLCFIICATEYTTCSEPGIGDKRKRESSSVASLSLDSSESDSKLSSAKRARYAPIEEPNLVSFIPASEAEVKSFQAKLCAVALPQGELHPLNAQHKKERQPRRDLITSTLLPHLHRDILELVDGYERDISHAHTMYDWPLNWRQNGYHELITMHTNGSFELLQKNALETSGPYKKIILGPRPLDVAIFNIVVAQNHIPLADMMVLNKHFRLEEPNGTTRITRIMSLTTGKMVGRPLALHRVGTSADCTVSKDNLAGRYASVDIRNIDENGSFCIVSAKHATQGHQNCYDWYSIETESGRVVPLLMHDTHVVQNTSIKSNVHPPLATIDQRLFNVATGELLGKLPQDDKQFSFFYFDNNAAYRALSRKGLIFDSGAKTTISMHPAPRAWATYQQPGCRVNPENAFAILSTNVDDFLYLIHAQATHPIPLMKGCLLRRHIQSSAISDDGTKLALIYNGKLTVFNLA